MPLNKETNYPYNSYLLSGLNLQPPDVFIQKYFSVKRLIHGATYSCRSF